MDYDICFIKLSIVETAYVGDLHPVYWVDIFGKIYIDDSCMKIFNHWSEKAWIYLDTMLVGK